MPLLLPYRNSLLCLLFSGFRNNELEEKIKQLGGNVTSSVSKNTSFLVVKNKKENSKNSYNNGESSEYAVPLHRRFISDVFTSEILSFTQSPFLKLIHQKQITSEGLHHTTAQRNYLKEYYLYILSGWNPRPARNAMLSSP